MARASLLTRALAAVVLTFACCSAFAAPLSKASPAAMPPNALSGASLPPATLLVTLHGGGAVRLRLTGGSLTNGSAPIVATLLPALDLTPSSLASQPRSMALLPSSGLVLLASADGTDPNTGTARGVVSTFDADAACAAGDGGGDVADARKANKKKRVKASGSAAALHVTATLVSPSAAHLDHPYGVAASPDGTVFVSNQGTGWISAFKLGGADHAPATLVAARFARHGQGKAGKGGATAPVRGIAYAPAAANTAPGGGGSPSDGALLFVASKDDAAVFAHSPSTGEQLFSIPMREPIGVVWDEAGASLFVGSARSKRVTASRFARDGKLLQSYEHDDGGSGGHAAGLAVYGGALIVLGQAAGGVHQFDVASGAYVATIFNNLDRPEGALLLSC